MISYVIICLAVLTAVTSAQTAFAPAEHLFAQGARLSSQAQLPAAHFGKPSVFATDGSRPSSVVTADLNGDGTPDLIVANQCQPTWNCAGGTELGVLSVLLGNGDGTFQSPVTYSTAGYNAYTVSVGDLNHDGVLDIVVANECFDATCNTNGIGVLLGKGDGTFQPAIALGLSGFDPYSAWLAIGDVNSDGKPDIVVSNQCRNSADCTTGTVTVLLGNGDGTFAISETYDSGGHYADQIVIADLNKDGRPDLVVGNGTTEDVGVMLGNGDGTFQPAQTYSSAAKFLESVAVGDVNEDGHPDLVLASACESGIVTYCSNEGVVSILLGNGDGTFSPASTYSSGGYWADGIALGDINGDHHIDLVVANLCSARRPPLTGCGRGGGIIGVLPGNGDGTFQAPLSFASGGYVPWAAAIADFTGDGKPDIATVNYTSNSVAVLENDFVAVTTTRLASSLSPSMFGQPVTIAASVTSNPAISDGETISFYDRAVLLGTAPIIGGKATLNISSLSAASHVIRAMFSGDLFHKASFGAITQIVGRYGTATTLSSNKNPSSVGEPVMFTAQVSTQGSCSAAGSVRFLDGTTGIRSVRVTGGIATFTRSGMTKGSHAMKAVYLGDSCNAPSTSVMDEIVQ
jgi:hypothetical protein